MKEEPGGSNATNGDDRAGAAMQQRAAYDAPPDAWTALQRWTAARVALGRAGASTPTQPLLEFQLDHALARDAIAAELDTAGLRSGLSALGFEVLAASSRATDRTAYLRRPDLGRQLSAESAAALQRQDAAPAGVLTVVVGEGLSALAPNLHAVALLRELRNRLHGWVWDAAVLATGARVALGDPIGAVRGAEAVLVLLGERPGLRAADSLGAYLTYGPRPGRTDAERNCVSNIRAEGLSCAAAAEQLAALLTGARRLGATGTALKPAEAASAALPTATGTAGAGT